MNIEIYFLHIRISKSPFHYIQQYLETHTNYEEGERIPFHFCDDGYVKLEAIPSEYNGWTLKPEDEEKSEFCRRVIIMNLYLFCVLFSMYSDKKEGSGSVWYK